MSILELISNLAGAVKEWLGFQSKKLDLKNAKDMKDAAVAQQEVDAVSKTERAVAKRDVAEMQKELAE